MFGRITKAAGKVFGTAAIAAAVLVSSGAAPVAAELYTVDDVVYATAPVIDDFWASMFDGSGVDYETPGVYYYNTPDQPGVVDTTCGEAILDNAFYCLLDQSIYLDYGFMQDVIDDKGDFAAALVIAHEWGHHVHNSLGIVRTRDGEIDQEGEYMSIQTELLSDCFAGSVASYWNDLGMIEEGDLDEGYEMVLSIADEPGSDPNDPRAHGDADARMESFFSGFEIGDPASCGYVVDEITEALA